MANSTEPLAVQHLRQAIEARNRIIKAHADQIAEVRLEIIDLEAEIERILAREES